jgi:hypothetical protein
MSQAAAGNTKNKIMEDDYIFKISEELSKQLEAVNRAPLEEFDYLSPLDMSNILYALFQEGSPVQYAKTLAPAVLDAVPFYQLFSIYLKRVGELQVLKLTAKGNLPRKICKELYDLGLVKEEMIERGIVKLNKEGDSIALQNLKIIGNLSGLTKKRHNKLSLTKKGEKLLQNGQELNLFRKLFETNILKFNLGYHDLYESRKLQGTFGYTLYLLLRYGNEKKSIQFYADKVLEAFPELRADFMYGWGTPESMFLSCFEVRFFDRLLDFYGFVQLDKREPAKRKNRLLITTPAFRSVFEIEHNNFQFLKARYDA